MTAPHVEIIHSGVSDHAAHAWPANDHPLALPTASDKTVSRASAPAGSENYQPITIASNTPAAAPEGAIANPAPEQSLDIPPIFAAGPADAPVELPAPIQKAIESGAPIRYSSAGEDAAANKQPDFFLTPEGKLVANPQATPSADGSVSIQLQSKNAEDNKSLRDAITHQSEMQRQAAKDMIRYFQKSNPGKPVPQWMQDLADAQPKIPDFVPPPSSPNTPAAPPPENGFSNRGTNNGSDGFRGNGGFDSNGYFNGNGGSGDGSISSGERGRPLGPGEVVQAKQLYDYFVEKGFTPAQASGILGNIQTESSFNTSAYNSGEGAIGLCQWEGGRRTELEHFAASQGKPVTDWHVQADFIMHELSTSETGAYAALKAATTPEQAAQAFQSRYERSASLGNRADNARLIHSQLA
jgi:hypothetical protein